MEIKLTTQQISVLRTLNGGENITNTNKARIIEEIDMQAPGLVVIVPQIGLARPKPLFGTVLSTVGQRFLAAHDTAKKIAPNITIRGIELAALSAKIVKYGVQ